MTANGSNWMPIDTAPKDGTLVDIWRPWLQGGKAFGGERCTDMRRMELAPDNVFYAAEYRGPTCVRDATHWMPAPEPPK